MTIRDTAVAEPYLNAEDEEEVYEEEVAEEFVEEEQAVEEEPLAEEAEKAPAKTPTPSTGSRMPLNLDATDEKPVPKPVEPTVKQEPKELPVREIKVERKEEKKPVAEPKQEEPRKENEKVSAPAKEEQAPVKHDVEKKEEPNAVRIPLIPAPKPAPSVTDKVWLVVSDGNKDIALDVEDLLLCPDEVVFDSVRFFVSDAELSNCALQFSAVSSLGSIPMRVQDSADFSVGNTAISVWLTKNPSEKPAQEVRVAEPVEEEPAYEEVEEEDFEEVVEEPPVEQRKDVILELRDEELESDTFHILK